MKKFTFKTEWKPLVVYAFTYNGAIKKFINLGLPIDDILAIEYYYK